MDTAAFQYQVYSINYTTFPKIQITSKNEKQQQQKRPHNINSSIPKHSSDLLIEKCNILQALCNPDSNFDPAQI